MSKLCWRKKKLEKLRYEDEVNEEEIAIGFAEPPRWDISSKTFLD